MLLCIVVLSCAPPDLPKLAKRHVYGTRNLLFSKFGCVGKSLQSGRALRYAVTEGKKFADFFESLLRSKFTEQEVNQSQNSENLFAHQFLNQAPSISDCALGRYLHTGV